MDRWCFVFAECIVCFSFFFSMTRFVGCRYRWLLRNVSSVFRFCVMTRFWAFVIFAECLVRFAFLLPSLFFAYRLFLGDVSSILSTFALLRSSVLTLFTGCLVRFAIFFGAVSCFCDPSRAFFVFFRIGLYEASFLRNVSSIYSVFVIFSLLSSISDSLTFLMMSRPNRLLLACLGSLFVFFFRSWRGGLFAGCLVPFSCFLLKNRRKIWWGYSFFVGCLVSFRRFRDIRSVYRFVRFSEFLRNVSTILLGFDRYFSRFFDLISSRLSVFIARA